MSDQHGAGALLDEVIWVPHEPVYGSPQHACPDIQSADVLQFRPSTHDKRVFSQRGYFAYHAVPTNIHMLGRFRSEVLRHWQKALRRRSQRDGMNWNRMNSVAQKVAPASPGNASLA